MQHYAEAKTKVIETILKADAGKPGAATREATTRHYFEPTATT
jgi:hypothetical protein